MLVDDPDNDGWNPPHAVNLFKSEVATALSAWHVNLVAYDTDSPDTPEFVSATVVAKTGDVRVHISRHAGGNVVFLLFRDSDPVPFEDLAVAKHVLNHEKHVLNHAELLARASAKNPDDDSIVQPLVPFPQVLACLQEWAPDLAGNLSPDHENRETVAGDRDEVAAVVLGDVGHLGI